MHQVKLVSLFLALSGWMVYSLPVEISNGAKNIQTIDQIIVAATNTSQDAEFLLKEDLVKVELDMLYRKEDWEAIVKERQAARGKNNHRKKRKAIRDTRWRWTNKQLVYYLYPGYFSSSEIAIINSGLREYEEYTCLTFRQRGAGDRNYVEVSGGSGCSSMVGMIGGVQRLSLDPGCRTKSLVLHEFGHALGFQHEQCRPDRDPYVTIYYQNIPASLHYNFDKFSNAEVNDYGVPYDYTSVLHYGKTAFSYNGQPTIITTDPAYQDIIGTTSGLSFRDIKLANLMYDCAENCGSMSCPGEGYVGKDCRCYCPGNPIRLCDGSEPSPTPGPSSQPSTSNPNCRDDHENCESWASNGECEKNPDYMLVYCKKSCDVCGGDNNCKDDNASCEYWASIGECQKNPNYMLVYCKRSCNAC